MSASNPLGDIGGLDAARPFDVCVIGSGPAGTVIGKSLAERGVRTLILESGKNLVQWLLDGRLRQLASSTCSGDTNYPVRRTRARAVGGTSNFWTGRGDRFHPTDFEKHAYTPDLNPWPIRYDEIEPYYERAERTLRVRGGPRSEYAPPRKNSLPLPPSTDISGLKALMSRVGVTLDDSPTATPTKALRFFRVQNEILPGFLVSPHATLVPAVTVTRLVSNSNGRIIGAEVHTLDGKKKMARARAYVVACGGIDSPRLLLLSRSSVFPNGIGNPYDRVGRGFNDHPGVNFYANIQHTLETIYPRHKIGRTYQFYNHFREKGLGSVYPVVIQSWVFPHHLMSPRVSQVPRQLFSIASRLVRPTLYIGATIEMRPCDTNRVTLEEDKKDRFGNPLAHLSFNYSSEDLETLDRIRELIREFYHGLHATHVQEAEVTWSRHHIGTCRMGVDPKTSVTDPNLRVHDCPNLYVCGSEVFVTGSAVPPVLTIVALAHRLSDHLVERLENCDLAI